MDFSNIPSNPLDNWGIYIISILIGLITCIKSYMGGVDCPSSNRIDGKTIIITGASTGIGFETCRELIRRGGQVIMCCRSIQNGIQAMNTIKKEYPGANVILKKLDLSSKRSIKEFSECLGDRPVDVLINNAGVIFHPYAKTEDNFEIHTGTNYLGHFLLTHLLLKNLKKANRGRIINVCAGLHLSADAPLSCEPDPKNYVSKEWFMQSKIALFLMTKHLARLLTGTNVTINAVNPGMVRGTRHLRYSTLYKNLSVRISLMPWMWLFMKSPKRGAQTTIFLATDTKIEKSSGKYFSNCQEEDVDGKVVDLISAKTLYEKSCKLLDISPYEESD